MKKPRVKNIRSISVRNEGLNSRVERLNGTMRDREKVMRGMQTKESAQKIIESMRIHYNFVRIHSSLKKTPAEQAGIDLQLEKNKKVCWNYLQYIKRKSHPVNSNVISRRIRETFSNFCNLLKQSTTQEVFSSDFFSSNAFSILTSNIQEFKSLGDDFDNLTPVFVKTPGSILVFSNGLIMSSISSQMIFYNPSSYKFLRYVLVVF